MCVCVCVCVWAGAAGVDLLARQAGVAHGKMGGRGRRKFLAALRAC